jgi:SpoVK/Ycf46/Vps4 family AAA+-type ATPase
MDGNNLCIFRLDFYIPYKFYECFAVNRPDALDPALRRAGWFDRNISLLGWPHRKREDSQSELQEPQFRMEMGF